jgi:release factor glutamine methyltransferase
LLAHDETELTEEQLATFYAAAEKRQQGLPVAYITGKKEFFGLEFYVTPDVLIPKPDTELLVEKALELIKTLPDASAIEIADICCGSGCIAIAVLANTNRNIHFVATDISEAALTVARKNAERLLPSAKLAALTFVKADLLEGVSNMFDIMLANPPYVPSTIAQELLRDGRSEPLLALDGGKDGLDCIRKLIPQTAEHLATGGYLLLECGEYNIAQAKKYLEEHGFTDIVEYTDLGSQLRLLQGKNHRASNIITAYSMHYKTL